MNQTREAERSPESSGEPEYLTLRDILAAAVAMRLTLTLIVVGAIAASMIVAFVSRPLYRASVVVIPAESGASGLALSGGLSGLASLAGVRLPQGQDASVESLAVLQSRQFTESFIRDRDLLPVLFSKEWDPVKKGWNVSGSQVPTFADACRYFDQKIRRVANDRKTGIVTLSLDWYDRRATAEWANELMSRLNAAMRRRAINEADASIAVLQERLRNASVISLQQSLAQLLESQIRQRTIATVREDYVFRVIDPAVVPEADDVVFPRLPLLLAFGAFSGLALAGLLAIFRAMRKVRQ